MMLYDILRENGPDGIVGHEVCQEGQPFRIASLLAVGGSMLIYDLEQEGTGKRDYVLKVPKDLPGTEKYTKTMKGYMLAIERLVPFGLGAKTYLVRLYDCPVFVQEKVIPLAL